MGKSGRFLVFPVVYFNSKQEYKKWTRLAKKYTQSNKYLQKRGEIKCSSMRYEEKKELFIALHKRNVDFKIWCGVIDTNHEHYVERFISGRNPKELSFNYVLNQLFQRYIAKTIVSQTVKMYIDNRNLKTGSLYTLEGYINVESMHNKNHRCERVDVRYRDSKDCYGIQLADLIAKYNFYTV